jgi:hypothetical protein
MEKLTTSNDSEATLDRFLLFWNFRYQGCPPLRYLLRKTYPERWLRIHSLPTANRYATHPGEAAQLLRRHNEVEPSA